MENSWKIVIVNYLDRFIPRTYVNQHTINTHLSNLRAQGSYKVYMIIENLEDMAVGYPTTVGVKNYIILNHKPVGTTTSPTM